MSTIRKCDMCGDEVTSSEGGGKNEVRVNDELIVAYDDLCPECEERMARHAVKYLGTIKKHHTKTTRS